MDSTDRVGDFLFVRELAQRSSSMPSGLPRPGARSVSLYLVSRLPLSCVSFESTADFSH